MSSHDAPVTISHEEAHRLLYTLKQAARHLVAVDVGNATANLADVRHRPLTRLVSETYDLFDGLVHQPGESEPPVGTTG